LSAIVGLLGLLAGASMPALAQSPPADRNRSARELVRAWKTVPPVEQDQLVAAMLARRSEVAPVLRDAARTGDRAEKVFACSMIAEMRDRDGVEAVVAASTDADVKVRRRAVTALRILADRRAATRLRELVRSEADLGVLKTALAALGRLGLRSDAKLVEPFLAHPDDNVRVVAAGVLAMLGDERGLDLVVQATYAADPSVRKNATYALGLFRARWAGERLEAILADPQGAWKSYALIAQAERRLAAQSSAERVSTLRGLAGGRSRTLAEWAVDKLTDIGTKDAAAALRSVRDKGTPVGAMAARRLAVIEPQP
jgi:hypothetical protein